MFRTIVVGTDGSATADAAVDQAGELAAVAGAMVHVVTAYAGAVRPEHDLADREKVADAPFEVLRSAEERLAQAGVTQVEVHKAGDDPAEALLRVAEQVGADLIVVGDKGVGGLRGLLLGSVAERVVRHAACAVLVCRTT